MGNGKVEGGLIMRQHRIVVLYLLTLYLGLLLSGSEEGFAQGLGSVERPYWACKSPRPCSLSRRTCMLPNPIRALTPASFGLMGSE